VHLLATPLITDSHGQKFGKSEGNAVWLSPELTSPYAFYQYWLNVEDASVGALLKVFTDRSADEIEELERAVRERPQAREAQRTLALDVTSLVHGSDAAAAAIAASGALFGRGELGAVDAPTLHAALSEAGLHQVAGELPSVVGLLVTGGLARSLSEARRAVAEGGANINNIRITDPEYVPDRGDLLHGRYLVLRRGKKSVAGVELVAEIA
jgi:tyrosyl-tRNA synthetase